MTLGSSLSTTDSQIEFAKTLAPVIKLNIGEWNANLLQKQAHEIVKRFPIPELNQLNLTVRSETEKNPYDGLGQLEARIRNGINESELDFKFFNSEFTNTIFFEIYQKLQAESPFPLGRVRLMKLNRKSCYSVHEDGSLRFHLPIVTNPETYFCFEHKGFYNLPAVGQIFCTNTLLRHTVINGGPTERIHLVFSTSWKETSIERIKTFLSQ